MQLKKQELYHLIRSMQDILKKADHLMRVWSVEDIMDFLPDLLLFIVQVDDQNAENEINLDGIEDAEYIRLKKEKKGWLNSYSDIDINKLAKHKARQTYDRLPADKKVAEHCKMYLEQLKQRKIDLQSLDKKTREAM